MKNIFDLTPNEIADVFNAITGTDSFIKKAQYESKHHIGSTNDFIYMEGNKPFRFGINLRRDGSIHVVSQEHKGFLGYLRIDKMYAKLAELGVLFI